MDASVFQNYRKDQLRNNNPEDNSEELKYYTIATHDSDRLGSTTVCFLSASLCSPRRSEEARIA
jgi:hypothetical protein